MSIILVFAFTLVSCNEYINKAASVVVGGAAGAYIGNELGDGNKVAIFGGTLLGAYIGNEIGKFLEEQDRKEHQIKTQEALSSGEDQSWSNPENKTSGKISVTKSVKKKEIAKIPVLKKKVTQVPPLEIIGETYKANKKLNVRGGPSTDYEKIGKLSKNQNVNVVGKVKEKEWYFISHEGVGSGFVYASLLKPAPSESPDPTEEKLTESDIALSEVKTERVCRTIEQEITLEDGSTHVKTVQACQGPNGWEVQS